MCGRFKLETPEGEIASRFFLRSVPVVRPRYNIAPGQPALVIRATADGEREALYMSWGLTPPWDPRKRIINARSETVGKTAAFREGFERRRCLVPADGFYEWSGKRPFLVRLRNNELFAFAAIFSADSFAILTTRPNEVVGALHNRMPVIIRPEDYSLWLSPDIPDSRLFEPFDAHAIEAFPVGTWVNKVTYDGPLCAEPISHNIL